MSIMRKLFYSFLIVLTIGASALFGQIVEKPEAGKFALVGGTVFTVSNGIIENGIVLINGKRIEYVGTSAEFDNSYTSIDVSGKNVYPGFIESGSQLTMSEINAVNVTNHTREIGDFIPHVRAFSQFNPSSEHVPVARVNGITTAIVLPQGSLVAGMATLVNLYGYSPDSMAVLPNAALHINFPNKVKPWWSDQSEEEFAKGFKKSIESLHEFFDKAVAYNKMWVQYESKPKGKRQPDKDVALHAMREVVTGKTPVMLSVDLEKNILAALDFIESRPESRFILSGVSEGWRVADKIAKAEVPALVGPVLSTPTRAYDRYDRPYANAGLMHKAGVKVGIRTGNNENIRNLVYHAGYAGVYGLGMEEALRAITMNPAEIFGVADHLGSLSVGKLANVVVTDGDVFETMTQVEEVFVEGLRLPLVSRHTKLYEEYLNRDVR